MTRYNLGLAFALEADEPQPIIAEAPNYKKELHAAVEARSFGSQATIYCSLNVLAS